MKQSQQELEDAQREEREASLKRERQRFDEIIWTTPARPQQMRASTRWSRNRPF